MVILKMFVVSLTLNIEAFFLCETKFCFLGCLLCKLYKAPQESHISVLKMQGLNFHFVLSLKKITKISYISNRPDRLPQMCYFAALEFKKMKTTRKKNHKILCVPKNREATLWGQSAFHAAAVLLFYPHRSFPMSQLSSSFCA